MNHKLWNIGSTERYILHIQMLMLLHICVDRIYPIELEIKDATDRARPVSYLDLHFEIDSERRLRMKLYDKRDHFHFPIVNFQFI
jgi:hypothetical protein